MQWGMCVHRAWGASDLGIPVWSSFPQESWVQEAARALGSTHVQPQPFPRRFDLPGGSLSRLQGGLPTLPSLLSTPGCVSLQLPSLLLC